MYGGCITKNTAKNGGGIYVSNSYSRTSSVTIRSGSITANNATDNGGGVYLDGNVYFSMTGGSITNNTATQNGGGVYVDTDENRSFTLNSGSITDNKATQDGGGVLVNGTFIMSGGSITNNSANNGDDDGTVTYGQGGGVCVGSNGLTGIFKVSGKATITQNWQNGGDISTGNWTNSNRTYNNVCLYKNSSGIATITITGALSNRIGVNTNDLSESLIVAKGEGYKIKESDKTLLSYDDPQTGYTLFLDTATNQVMYNAHQHIWKYEVVNRTTITATCTNTGTCTNTDGGSITIQAPDNLIYDGRDKSATIHEDNWQGQAVKDIKISYRMDGQAGDFPEGSTIKDAGTYIASITVGDETAKLTYAISPKALKASEVSAIPSGNLEYDGQEQTFTDIKVYDTTTNPRTELSHVADYTLSGNTAKDAGNYRLTVNLRGNYTLSNGEAPVTAPWHIDQRVVSLSWAGTENRTYHDGQTVTATVNGVIDGDDVSAVVTGGDNTELGEHTATATLTGAQAGNYALSSANDAKCTYTVGKKSIDIPAANTTKFVYSGQDQTYTLAASGNYVIVAFTDGKLTVSARPSSGGGGGGRTPTYPVTTPSGVDSSKKSAAKGDVVTITVKPEPGFEVEEVIVTDAKGNQIKVTANADGTFSFIQPDSQVEVQTVYAEAGGPFSDVARSDYFYDAVTWAKDNNITGGVGFQDVSGSDYFAAAVAWAKANDITDGVGNGLFGSKNSCTRAQIVTFLYLSQQA